MVTIVGEQRTLWRNIAIINFLIGISILMLMLNLLVFFDLNTNTLSLDHAEETYSNLTLPDSSQRPLVLLLIVFMVAPPFFLGAMSILLTAHAFIPSAYPTARVICNALSITTTVTALGVGISFYKLYGFSRNATEWRENLEQFTIAYQIFHLNLLWSIISVATTGIFIHTIPSRLSGFIDVCAVIGLAAIIRTADPAVPFSVSLVTVVMEGSIAATFGTYIAIRLSAVSPTPPDESTILGDTSTL